MTTLLWLLAIALVLVGIAGTVLPALPGAALVFVGLALGAWIDDFTRVSGWTVGLLGVLTVLAWATDYVAAALGAKRVGASPQALVGAALGTLAGVFTGFVGLLFLPLAGAAIGQYLAQRDLRRAGHVGVATWIGMLVGTAVKIALVFAMIGVFAFAYFFWSA
jgi:uncharacterized protein YqgC (DUF456 family)